MRCGSPFYKLSKAFHPIPTLTALKHKLIITWFIRILPGLLHLYRFSLAMAAQMHFQAPLAVHSQSCQRQISSAEAIARFRPSPKEIIRGIAPHVLEEHGMRRRRSRSQPRYSQVQIGGNRCSARRVNGTITRESPLRFSAIISWDSDGCYPIVHFDQQGCAGIVAKITPSISSSVLQVGAGLSFHGDAKEHDNKAMGIKTERSKARLYLRLFRSFARFRTVAKSF